MHAFPSPTTVNRVSTRNGRRAAQRLLCQKNPDARTDHRISERKMPDPERLTFSGSVRPFQGRESFLTSSVGVAQRSPTAIDLNPFGFENTLNLTSRSD